MLQLKPMGWMAPSRHLTQYHDERSSPDMRFSWLNMLGAIFLGLSLVSCNPTGSDLPPLDQSPVSDTSYLLGPGDQLHVTIYDEEDLSGEVPVGDAGMAVLPLIGPVRAAGATPRQLEEAVRAKLISDHYLNDPNVTVQIIHFRPIYILGEVHKPDDHPYVPGMTVRAAIALAGGFTPRANQSFVIVTRQNHDYRAAVSSLLRPDDLVQVSERFF
jgi:polysaccharide biosynthesis/export protein